MALNAQQLEVPMGDRMVQGVERQVHFEQINHVENAVLLHQLLLLLRMLAVEALDQMN